MKRTMISELKNLINSEVCIRGWVHRLRKLKAVTFIIIRDRTGLIQCVAGNSLSDQLNLGNEAVVEIIGNVVEGKNTIGPVEIQVSQLRILNGTIGEVPIEVNGPELNVNLNTLLNNRVLSLRHEKTNAVFKLQNLIIQGFREFLIHQGFTEIFTPKIVAEGAEGGSEIFEVKYFENRAYLAQSPQFYKQMLVGAGFERVFEIGHAYRAEQHNTNRHLNEYVSMDFEMGFIENEEDVMSMEEELLKFLLQKLKEEGTGYLDRLQANLPVINGSIPKMKLKDAIEILRLQYGKTDLEGDLDPEGEQLICQYAYEKLGCEFLFLTHYSRRKRPMYAMPLDDHDTRSFDLLFRGIEITTGGQRIHEYDMLIKNIEYKGLTPEKYENYTAAFKYGMPPHGGLAIGLERLTARLLGIENVREASFFPRDRHRITP